MKFILIMHGMYYLYALIIIKNIPFQDLGKIFSAFLKLINAHKIKGNEKEGLKEDIKSLSNEKSELKNKLNNFDRKIKQYELIIDDYKSKLEKKILKMKV